MISVKSSGDFNNVEKMLKKSIGFNYMKVLDRYGRLGVEALAANTPIKSGLTASSWSYSIEKVDGRVSIIWTNSNIKNGYFNVALMLQYGHGTRNGGYVNGIDYINPALKPVFDKLAEDAWREVTSK